MKTFCLLFALLVSVVCSQAADAQTASPFQDAKRVVFLGDSNTFAGHYIVYLEAQVLMADQKPLPEMINLGLSSETCNGRTEPDHPFPRPNVQERIDRVLAKLKPDVVVVCYGMNDGIYHPPSKKNFAAYCDGVNQIIAKVHASGAKLILMTPPAFDPLPMKKKGKLVPMGAKDYSWKAIYENYDDVMKQYAEWIKEQSNRVEMVIDLHRPVSDYVAEKRLADPDFTMSPDGVHVNHDGHEVIAKAILQACGRETIREPEPALLKLIDQRQKLMRDAWLSEVGHLRPGIKSGLPITEAKKKAAVLNEEIATQLAKEIAQ